MPSDGAENGESAGFSSAGSSSAELSSGLSSGEGSSTRASVDVQALFDRLREEVKRSGADPGAAASGGEERRAARAEAERLWPVSADRSLRLRPGVRGGVGSPVKALLRKLMRWYVEPLAYDQRSFNAAALRLVDDLQEQIDRLQAELDELRKPHRS